MNVAYAADLGCSSKSAAQIKAIVVSETSPTNIELGTCGGLIKGDIEKEVALTELIAKTPRLSKAAVKAMLKGGDTALLAAKNFKDIIGKESSVSSTYQTIVAKLAQDMIKENAILIANGTDDLSTTTMRDLMTDVESKIPDAFADSGLDLVIKSETYKKDLGGKVNALSRTALQQIRQVFLDGGLLKSSDPKDPMEIASSLEEVLLGYNTDDGTHNSHLAGEKSDKPKSIENTCRGDMVLGFFPTGKCDPSPKPVVTDK